MGVDSARLLEEARRYIPGGVNSPVRSFSAVGTTPPFIARGRGSRLWDVEGREYVDYVGSWGPLILGHAHPRVVAAVREAADLGTSFGAPTPGEVALARRLVQALPAVEMIRLVNSGTEATMSALRLARACTGRERVVKFAGCYHGHVDQLLVQAGSGALTLGVPDSPGVPTAVAAQTTVLPYNDLAALEECLRREGERVAAVILEPVAGNMGVVLPRPGFLEGVRRLTREYGVLLIYDEVITGFRVGPRGAQGLFAQDPDLTCLGKIIGGGLPVGAYGGRREIMEQVSPAGPVYQAGTLSGNPLAVAAGLATLEELAGPEPYARLEEMTARLTAALAEAAREAGAGVRINRQGSMFTLFFTEGEVADLGGAQTADRERFARYFRAMLGRGIYLPPSQFEANFVSLAHTEEDLERTWEAARASFREL